MKQSSENIMCARCLKKIPETYAEHCWKCLNRICVDCWEKFGECYHEDEDDIDVM
jgi:hypothetical protein